ncbi:MAG: hypothetical protein ACJ8F7_22235 [Gemmataceae bacterium]
MPTDEEIRKALHASRVVSLNLANPHGPLGLDQLAAVGAQVRGEDRSQRVQRPIALRAETWEKLDHLAQTASRAGSKPSSAGEIASALLEQLVAAEK